jgi:hypothetical protein
MKKKYYLATNEKDVFHYGCLEHDQEIVTGQPVLIVVDSIEEFLTVLENYNLKIDIEECLNEQEYDKETY